MYSRCIEDSYSAENVEGKVLGNNCEGATDHGKGMELQR